ncbi:hypothetical protein MRB53_042029 [Persea americana]|nr:hypothetical protein MRB53_042029 [Persea americana]
MLNRRDGDTLRRGAHDDGTRLTAEEREALLRPLLPSVRTSLVASQEKRARSLDGREDGTSSSPELPTRWLPGWPINTLRGLFRYVLHKLLFVIIHTIFSVYIDLRQAFHIILFKVQAILYYHHHTPELIQRDVKGLSKLPKHLSVILEARGTRRENEALTRLGAEVAELAVWCACAGIPMLSVYEQSGMLKSQIPYLHKAVSKVLRTYFPEQQAPSLQIRAPNQSAYSPPPPNSHSSASISILLLSASDGEATLVDLTKTLTEMAQRGKIEPSDVTMELVDAEITESSCNEPDLLIVLAPSGYHSVSHSSRARLSKSKVREARGGQSGNESFDDGAGGDLWLRGYPPWQDNVGSGYHVFLQALHRYAKAEMRIGR